MYLYLLEMQRMNSRPIVKGAIVNLSSPTQHELMPYNTGLSVL